MSKCTNVCGIKVSELRELPCEQWLLVERPSGKKLRVRLDDTGLYLLNDPESEEPGVSQTFSSLQDLKTRLRQFS